MRAVELQGPGFEGLKVVERPVPEPGPGEIVLRLKAASLNYRDLVTIQGARAGIRYPVVPLSDGCGEVAALGEGVTRVAVGDRVAPCFFPEWIAGPYTPERTATPLGNPVDGCLQQYLKISAEGVSRAPAHMSDLEVAALPCAALTAWRALVVQGDVKAGDTVLVQGTGGVSIFALQFAKLLGAEVVITSSSDAKLERARELGADHTINYRSTPEWAKEALRLTEGRGAHHVVDVGGGGTLGQSLACVAPEGQVSVIGILGGLEEPLPIRLLMGRNAVVKGIMVGSRTDFEEMCRAIELHQLRAQISDVFDFDDHVKALELMRSAGHFGKICLRID